MIQKLLARLFPIRILEIDDAFLFSEIIYRGGVPFRLDWFFRKHPRPYEQVLLRTETKLNGYGFYWGYEEPFLAQEAK